MKNFLTVFALMVSVSGVAVSLAREEVRCYLGLSEGACHSVNESSSSTPKADSSSSSSSKPQQTEETQEEPPANLPTSLRELSKVGQEIKEAVSPPSDSSQEVTKPATEAEEPPTAPPEVSQQPTEETKEVSSPATEAQPITHSVELEVIPPPEDAANQSETTQN